MPSRGSESGAEPIKAMYETTEPNRAVELYSGQIVFRHGSIEITGPGTLHLEWLAPPSIRFRLRTKKEISRDLRLVFEPPGDDSGQVELSELGITCESFATSAGHVSGSELEVSGVVRGDIVVGEKGRISSLLFHLPNVPNLARSPDQFVWEEGGKTCWIQRLVLDCGEWTVTLDPVMSETDLAQALKAGRGYGITRVGRLQRCDGKTFSLERAVKVLEVLQHLLSFAFERWCTPILLVGLAQNEKEVCKAWAPVRLRLSRFQPHQGWFDPHHPGSLKPLFHAVFQRWKDEQWRESLKDAIYWYVEMHEEPVHLETSLILGQTVLEMFAWLLLVETSSTVAQGPFDRLPAADKIKLLLSLSSIPVAPPKELNALSSLAKAENWQGPDCLAEIRNSIIHRSHKKRKHADVKRLTDCSILHDSFRLVCWYVELILLRILGYDEPYSNRLKDRFVGQVELVPWQTGKGTKPTES